VDNGKNQVLCARAPGTIGIILWFKGSEIKTEIEDTGFYDLDAVGLPHDLCPIGICIWEGTMGRCYDSGDFYCKLIAKGTYRRPTDSEWECIKQNKSPFEEQVRIESNFQYTKFYNKLNVWITCTEEGLLIGDLVKRHGSIIKYNSNNDELEKIIENGENIYMVIDIKPTVLKSNLPFV
jgi:hypothetical protein